jgi:iron complex transport system ATP-binding protein
MTNGLSAREVSVRFGHHEVLTAATVALSSGELVAVVGPNGSGKSTLLRSLAGLLRPSTGTVELEGAPLTGLARRAIARRVSFLPQDTRCDFAFSVEEMVAMGRHPHRGRFQPEGKGDHDAVDAAIATCDLEHLRTRTVDRLSGGERQRVAVARCLAADPAVMLFDEPTAHLDLEHGLALFGLCRRLADEGRAVAIATHDLATITRFATRTVVLHRGRLVANGTPHDVLTPSLCRDVFGVDMDLVRTASGEPVAVFNSRAPRPDGRQAAAGRPEITGREP